mmetsp:Transcript_7300/g.9458  ORF Transcript_7300/g.9458 Transcript_7300/m.9458 type:complete len:406 (+) Transcript_7300:321-1538(+)
MGSNDKVPRRVYGRGINHRLPEDAPIVGLGCSSFSNFFSGNDHDNVTIPLNPRHQRVVEWINTVRESIASGVNLLDTAPWYGHGISETLIGLALTYDSAKENNMEVVALNNFSRDDIIINTKVGRYDAEPGNMFDFSASRVRSSILESIRRMKCNYIDVIQLHDPEFSPSIDLLIEKTIPALFKMREEGYVRAVGITGYPLKVQHEIIVRSSEKGFLFDQALTYCHYNLHDQSLFESRSFKYDGETVSFFRFCSNQKIVCLAAAPLSMGLLTRKNPPDWHPASFELKESCKLASSQADDYGVNISDLAILFALAREDIPCTLLGIRDRNELKRAIALASRLKDFSGSSLHCILNSNEKSAITAVNKQLAQLPASMKEWDGEAVADHFWNELGNRNEMERVMRENS